MEFNEFKERLKEELSKKLAEAGVDVELVEQIVKKVNQQYNGLAVKRKTSNVAPTLNLDGYYKDYSNGTALEEILHVCVETAIKFLSGPNFAIEMFKDYNWVKNNLSLKLVSLKGDKKYLSDTPYKPLGDLAVVCTVVLESTEIGKGCVTITNKLLEFYNITKEQLFKDAYISAPKINPSVLFNPADDPHISEIDFVKGRTEILQGSVTEQVNGTSVIAYNGFLKEVGKEFKEDYYILLIDSEVATFIKRSAMSEQEVKYMAIFGSNFIPDSNFLTNTVYHYEIETDNFEKLDDYLARKAG